MKQEDKQEQREAVDGWVDSAVELLQWLHNRVGLGYEVQEKITEVLLLQPPRLSTPPAEDKADAVEFAEWTQNDDNLFSFKDGIWTPYPYTDKTPIYTTSELYQLFKAQPIKADKGQEERM